MWLLPRETFFREKKCKSELPFSLETANHSASLQGDPFSFITEQTGTHFSTMPLCFCQLPSLTWHWPSESLEQRLNCQTLNMSSSKATVRITRVRSSAHRNLHCYGTLMPPKCMNIFTVLVKLKLICTFSWAVHAYSLGQYNSLSSLYYNSSHYCCKLL